MDELPQLTPEEARVLGCLLEKEATTPEYYPLTLNGLIAACNQKSNREPVVEYEEETVLDAMDGLREKRLGMRVDQAGSRAAKYAHRLESGLPLERPERALLCTLLLRGPQTPGELRGRSERLHAFATVPQVIETLERMATELDWPLVVQLPKLPGRKESRYMHLLCGPPDTTAETPPIHAQPTERLAPDEKESLRGEIRALREELAATRDEVRAVHEEIRALRQSLE
ncbi:MAG: YceH family protein [Verrucomicrobiota bacterium]